MYLDPPVNAQQQRVQVTVTGAKFAAHNLEFSFSLLFAQRKGATDNLRETERSPGMNGRINTREQSGKNRDSCRRIWIEVI